MAELLKDRFTRLLLVTFVGGLYFLGLAFLMGSDTFLTRLEAKPAVEWALSDEFSSPEELVEFVNSRALHSFHVVTDVHQGRWHFHVIYE